MTKRTKDVGQAQITTDIQQPIRSVYRDGSKVVNNVKINKDNSTTSYSVVDVWYDGTSMDDSKVDEWGVYSKYKATGEYLREDKPNWGESFLEVDTIADLGAMSAYNLFLIKIEYYKGVRVHGYYTKGDTPRSINYVISETSKVDDGGSVIQVGEHKFVFEFLDNRPDPRYFGAKADDDSYDNSTAFSNILKYLKENNFFRPTFYIPEGFDGFYYTQTLNIPVDINVEVLSNLRCGNDTTGIIIGEVGKSNFVDVRIRLVKTHQSNWTSLENVGIRFINITQTTNTRIDRVQGTTIGCIFEGNGNQGVAYNKIFFGVLINNKYDVLLTQFANGWVNENLFFGGRFQRSTSVNNNKDKYGIWIMSGDGTYTNLNSNKFFKPSFEYRGDVFTDNTKEIIPILIDNGQLNVFEDIRNEGNNFGKHASVIIRTNNYSQKNKVSIQYGQNFDPLIGKQDLGLYASTEIYSLDHSISNASLTQKDTISITNLRDCFLQIGTNTCKVIKNNIFLCRYGNSTNTNQINLLVPLLNSIEIPSTRGIGVRVSTTSNKRFAIRAEFDLSTPFGGRYNIRCYDHTGTLLDNSNKNHVLGLAHRIPAYCTAFGGSWRNGSDTSSGMYFAVSDETAFIDIIFSGGNPNPSRIIAIFVQGIDGNAAILNALPPPSMSSAVIPIDTTKEVGTFISDSTGVNHGWTFVSTNWVTLLKISSSDGVWNISTGAVLTSATASYAKIDKQVALSGQLSFAAADADVAITLPFAPDYGGVYVIGGLTFTLSNTTTATVRSSAIGDDQPFQLNFKTA